jgi:hypothetical protein
VAVTDDVVEQEANKQPRHVVQRRCKRYRARDSEDERKVEVLEKRHLKLLEESPLDKWGNSTGHEEDEVVV